MCAPARQRTGELLYRAFDAGVDTVERDHRRGGNRLRLPPHRQAQACGQARALRQAGAQAGTAGARGRPGHRHGRSRADPQRARVGRATTAGWCSARAPACIWAASSSGLAEAAARKACASTRTRRLTGTAPHNRRRPRGPDTKAPRASAPGPAGDRHIARWAPSPGSGGASFRSVLTSSSPSRCRSATLDRLLPRRRMAAIPAISSPTSAHAGQPPPLGRTRALRRPRPGTSDRKSGEILQPRRCTPSSRICATARIDYCWGGMVDMTRDRLPRAGERNGVYYSMGYSGHGTQMSTLMGTVMAEVMDGAPTSIPGRTLPGRQSPGISESPGSFLSWARITG